MLRSGCHFVVTTSSGFEREARKEIESLIPGVKVTTTHFKGTLIAECYDGGRFLDAVKGAETKFIGKVYPVDASINITKEAESVNLIFEELMCLGKLKSGEKFSVRCFRRGSHNFSSAYVERELGSLLQVATGATVNLSDPEKVVIVQIFQEKAFLGIVKSEDIIVKRIAVARKYRRGKRPLTRAEHKIREAIESFGIIIEPSFEVLDVGAAPGGWTKVLAEKARRVVAVDPADLHPSIANLPNVTHLKCKAEEIPAGIGKFHMIVNDMNLDPAESARIMVRLSEHLVDGGSALMTVKFVSRERRRHISEAIRILEEAYRDFVVKRMPHNRFETTIFMRKG
ncbi:MAG: THUMP domain-containing protein [Nitrososphaerota archaeon]|nr:THUMP domain-containing protein [Candidatus Bathyarchaeota archaeon]MDW8049212.1 THUMP domain-containing protein [Nitrososphaerota archaeon]